MLLLLALLQTPPIQDFPELNRPGTFADLHGNIARACATPDSPNVDELLQREMRASYDVHGSNVPAEKWLALGCARGLLAGDRAPAKPGPLMDGGNSWAQGAERVMQQALAMQPGNARAAEVLGLVALDANDPDNLKTAAHSLVLAAEHGVVAPGALRACADLGIRLRAESGAKVCSERALQHGIDSTWHLTRLAQLAFRAADTALGNKLFILAVGAAHDSVARQEINWHLQWFLTPAEEKAWAYVGDAARTEWIKDKVVSRDIRDGQPIGARLAEHFKRLDHVEALFRLQVNRKTREALRTGPNMDEEATLGNDNAVRESCEAGMVLATEFRFYKRWQTDFDDRGVIWMRFGQPAKQIDANPSCQFGGTPKNHRELWLYEIDGQRMILNFEYEKYSGSVEATRLVSGVLGSYFCAVDSVRCGLTALSLAKWCSDGHCPGTTRTESDFVQPEQIVRLHQEDDQFISAGTTKDDNSPRGEANIPISSRFQRLWDPISGAPMALVLFALPIKELSVLNDGGSRTAGVRLELRQWDPKLDRTSDTSIVRKFSVPDTSLRRPNLVGFLTAPTTPGTTTWSLVAAQEGRRGRAYDLSMSPFAPEPVVLSDLVVGAESQGVVWNFHNTEIPLAPTGSVDRTKEVSLYYQVRSDVPHGDYRAAASLFRVKDGVARDSASLDVGYDQSLGAGINEIAPTIDVSRLDKGSYALEVRIMTAAGKVVARRRTMLDLY